MQPIMPFLSIFPQNAQKQSLFFGYFACALVILYSLRPTKRSSAGGGDDDPGIMDGMDTYKIRYKGGLR